MSPGGFEGVRMLGPADVEASFATRNQRVLRRRKGAGLWLWKPHLINATLASLPDGFILMYCDAQV